MKIFRWKKPHKFGAKRIDGFPSRLERAVYYKLRDREILGEIKDIKRQQTVVLVDGPKEHQLRWKIDFSFVDVSTGKTVYAEAKGLEDNVFKIKLKLFRANPPARLEIWRGSYQRPFLAEVIECNK